MPDEKKPTVKEPVIPQTLTSLRSYPPPRNERRDRIRVNAKNPDWSFWKYVPEVETWQACALALNIDPDTLERPEQELFCPLSDGFLTKSFPSDEAADNFKKLLRLLHANRETQHFTSSHNVHDPVRLCEFAAWCAPVVRGLIGCDIPEELAGLAKVAPAMPYQVKQMLPAELKVSNAPPPITPVGNAPFKPHQFDTNVKGSPDWKHWRHVSTVEIWQGLLLSLNIEPPGNGWLIDNAVGGTGDIPYGYLDSHGLTDEFIRRWKLVRNRLETLYASTGAPRNAELTNFLGLPLFAAWAIEFEWDNLPPEFVAMAQKSHTQADAPAATVDAVPVTLIHADASTQPWLILDREDPIPEQPWYTSARYFARQLVKDDSTLLTKRTALANKVVQSLTNAGIKKRGGKKPFDATTVLKAFANVSLG